VYNTIVYVANLLTEGKSPRAALLEASGRSPCGREWVDRVIAQEPKILECLEYAQFMVRAIPEGGATLSEMAMMVTSVAAMAMNDGHVVTRAILLALVILCYNHVFEEALVVVEEREARYACKE